MLLPEPQIRTFTNLLNDIENGHIKVPPFHRDFVWDMKESAMLIDSIIKGYPIGSFVFWRTKERLRFRRNIGNLDLPESIEGEFVHFVLDGQQRLTSLFAGMKGLKMARSDGMFDNYDSIMIDLEADEDEMIVTFDSALNEAESKIKLSQLLYGGLTLLSSFPDKYHWKIEEYKKRIQSYTFSIIQIKETRIEVAADIYKRLNVSGKLLED